jgi:hypothetical protein
MGTEYFYRVGPTEYGPVSSSDLRALAARHVLDGHSLIRRSDSDRWYRATQVRGLFDTSDRHVQPIARTARLLPWCLVAVSGAVNLVLICMIAYWYGAGMLTSDDSLVSDHGTSIRPLEATSPGEAPSLRLALLRDAARAWRVGNAPLARGLLQEAAQVAAADEHDLVSLLERALSSNHREHEVSPTSHDANEPDRRTPTTTPLPGYSIISDTSLGRTKRSVDVRLDLPIDEPVLRRLAEVIHAQKPEYDRTYICYWLPGMTVGTGAWATTHFDPDLDIQISAANTLDDPAPLPPTVHENLIGRWRDDRLYVSNTMTISKRSGVFYLSRLFEDGSRSEIMLREQSSDHGRRFDRIPTSRFGEYYVIAKTGELEMWDIEGLICTARRLE